LGTYLQVKIIHAQNLTAVLLII